MFTTYKYYSHFLSMTYKNQHIHYMQSGLFFLLLIVPRLHVCVDSLVTRFLSSFLLLPSLLPSLLQSPDVGFSCESDSDCVAGHIQEAGNGPNTGVCNDTTHTCVIRAWCPTEDENDNIT